jgi:peroxiredoxin
MLWVRFDEQDRQSRAPDFCLNSVVGDTVCLDDFYEMSNMVLIFLLDINSKDCQKSLSNFARRTSDYKRHQSTVVIIFPQTLQEMRVALHMNLSLREVLEKSPLLVLSDPNNKIRQAYNGLMSKTLIKDNDVTLFVLDTFGSPYTALISKNLDDYEIHTEVLSWLQYIEIQCPE